MRESAQEQFDLLVNMVDSRLPSYEMHGVTVEYIVTVTLACQQIISARNATSELLSTCSHETQ